MTTICFKCVISTEIPITPEPPLSPEFRVFPRILGKACFPQKFSPNFPISPEFSESLHQISENHAKSPKFARFPPQIIENSALWKQHIPKFSPKNCIPTRILPKFWCKFHSVDGYDWGQGPMKALHRSWKFVHLAHFLFSLCNFLALNECFPAIKNGQIIENWWKVLHIFA